MEGLFGFIHAGSRRYPDRIFVRCGDDKWTYRQAYAMSVSLSLCLLQSGIQKGDRVVIFCDNSIQYITAFFAVARLDAIAVPVNPAKMSDTLLYIIQKCSPQIVITCRNAIDKLNIISSRLHVPVLNMDEAIEWTCLDEEELQNYDVSISVDESDEAMILFTSGTTANPKGVTLTHQNLISNAEAIIDYLKLSFEDSVLMTLPFTYSYGNSVLLTHTLAGACIVIDNASAFPYKVLESIQKYEVSGFSTVGSYINLMLKYIKNSNTGMDFFKKLRYITFAGESTSNEDVMYISENYQNIKIYVMYGQTEASARLSYLPPELLYIKMGSVGKGLSNVKLRVVDEFGHDADVGALGEIIAHGPNIMKGYWEDEEATREVLKDGWLYTGDNAIQDEDGYIYIKGRKNDLIKHMGHRISPIEIESIINSYPCVKESAVIEKKVDSISLIMAFIVLEKECAMEEIRRYINAKLPAYMRPQVFETVEGLPRTESGKIRRSQLRSQAI